MNTKTQLPPKNMIEFRGVSFHINDILARAIVSGISLEIPQGETLILLGRSGSGKTTLLKLMNGMLLPTKGQIFVQDRSTAAWDPIDRKSTRLNSSHSQISYAVFCLI